MVLVTELANTWNWGSRMRCLPAQKDDNDWWLRWRRWISHGQ